jgi:isopentenyldiphosphate isomerase
MQEIITVVDKNNKIIGKAFRKDVRKFNLIHRATYIFVMNTISQLLIQKRTNQKDLYPGLIDLACSGTVCVNESYYENALRELGEELGIITTEIIFHEYFYYSDVKLKVWGSIFSYIYDGKINLQENEIEYVKKLPLDSVLSYSSNNNYSPDTKKAFLCFLKSNN